MMALVSGLADASGSGRGVCEKISEMPTRKTTIAISCFIDFSLSRRINRDALDGHQQAATTAKLVHQLLLSDLLIDDEVGAGWPASVVQIKWGSFLWGRTIAITSVTRI